MNLSMHCYNRLKQSGLKTVGDVLSYGDLKKIRNFGRRDYEEVQARLQEINRDLEAL